MISAGIVGIALAGAIYQLVGASRSRRRYAPPGRMIAVAGERLHLVCAGHAGPPVLFEAGIGASSLSWTAVMRDTASFARACAYDRAGLGWSDPARSPRTVQQMLCELRGVLTAATGGDPAVLVGHSFGAFLSLVYASRYPRDVAALVLVDPPSEWRVMTSRQSRMLWGAIQLSRLGAVLARLGVVRASLALLTGGAPGVPRRFARVFGPTAARTLEHLVGEVRKLPADVHPIVQAQWCQPKCFQSMAAHLGALRETAAAAAESNVRDIPLVVLSAGHHPAAVLAEHREIARLSPLGRHLVAPESGHWVQLDQPDLVVSAIRDVINTAAMLASSASRLP
jgi:pimeloyl-ACP methyl ester carboxylesterase